MRKETSKTRELLKLLLAGNKPQLLIGVYDMADSHIMVCANHVEGQKIVSKVANEHIHPNQAEAFVSQIVKDYPLFEVTINHVSREEVERISAKLEAEY